MKTVRLVHPSHARTVLTEAEAQRLRHHGWLELPDTRPLTRNAAKQRSLRERYKAEGLKRVAFYVPIAIADELAALRQPGETMSELLIRVIKLLRVL